MKPVLSNYRYAQLRDRWAVFQQRPNWRKWPFNLRIRPFPRFQRRVILIVKQTHRIAAPKKSSGLLVRFGWIFPELGSFQVTVQITGSCSVPIRGVRKAPPQFLQVCGLGLNK